MYSVELTPRVQRFLDKLDTTTRERIEQTLKRLERRPVPGDARFIGRHAGEKVFRYRIGDFRALYSVREAAHAILVHKIDKRSRVYS